MVYLFHSPLTCSNTGHDPDGQWQCVLAVPHGVSLLSSVSLLRSPGNSLQPLLGQARDQREGRSLWQMCLPPILYWDLEANSTCFSQGPQQDWVQSPTVVTHFTTSPSLALLPLLLSYPFASTSSITLTSPSSASAFRGPQTESLAQR